MIKEIIATGLGIVFILFIYKIFEYFDNLGLRKVKEDYDKESNIKIKK